MAEDEAESDEELDRAEESDELLSDNFDEHKVSAAVSACICMCCETIGKELAKLIGGSCCCCCWFEEPLELALDVVEELEEARDCDCCCCWFCFLCFLYLTLYML